MSETLIPIAVFLGFLLAAIGSGFWVADLSQPAPQPVAWSADVLIAIWSEP